MKLVYVWICCCWMVAAQLNDAQFTDSSTPKAQYLEGQLYEDVVLQQDNLLSDDCFTQRGCRCLQTWEFQGAQQIGCQNPDQDRAGTWCQIDKDVDVGCIKEDGQFADSQNFYGYCTCRSNTFNLMLDTSYDDYDNTVTQGMSSPSSPPPAQLQLIQDDNTYPPIIEDQSPPLSATYSEFKNIAKQGFQSTPTPTPTPTPIPASADNSKAPAPAPTPTPTPSKVSSDKIPSITPFGNRTNIPGQQIEAEDCVTIVNVGCRQSIHFLAFTDGGLLQSLEYEGYGYYQSSGWFMLDVVQNDFTRWCSPSGSVGIHMQKNSTDGSNVVVSSGILGSGQEVERCMNPFKKFDFLEYEKISPAISDEYVDKFFTLKNEQDAKLTCEEFGGVYKKFKILKSSTVLQLGINCEISQ